MYINFILIGYILTYSLYLIKLMNGGIPLPKFEKIILQHLTQLLQVSYKLIKLILLQSNQY